MKKEKEEREKKEKEEMKKREITERIEWRGRKGIDIGNGEGFYFGCRGRRRRGIRGCRGYIDIGRGNIRRKRGCLDIIGSLDTRENISTRESIGKRGRGGIRVSIDRRESIGEIFEERRLERSEIEGRGRGRGRGGRGGRGGRRGFIRE